MKHDLANMRFRAFLVGRLWEGVVHNINGPLQVISMNLEILKMQRQGESDIPQPVWDRLEQISNALEKCMQITDSLSRRKEIEDHELTPVVLEDLIKNEMEFWHSDLFFKHNVSKEFKAPQIATVVTSNPGMLQEVVDACIGILIEVLKTLESKGTLEIILEKQDSGYASGTFSITSDDTLKEGNILDFNRANDPEFFALCKEVLTERTESLGIAVEAFPTGIRLKIPLK